MNVSEDRMIEARDRLEDCYQLNMKAQNATNALPILAECLARVMIRNDENRKMYTELSIMCEYWGLGTLTVAYAASRKLDATYLPMLEAFVVEVAKRTLEE